MWIILANVWSQKSTLSDYCLNVCCVNFRSNMLHIDFFFIFVSSCFCLTFCCVSLHIFVILSPGIQPNTVLLHTSYHQMFIWMKLFCIFCWFSAKANQHRMEFEWGFWKLSIYSADFDDRFFALELLFLVLFLTFSITWYQFH